MKKPGFITRALMKALTVLKLPEAITRSLFLPRTKFDYAREVGDGLSSSVVAAPLFWIMRRFAEAVFIIRYKDEIIKDHKILKLLKRPNAWYSGRLLRMAVALSYTIDGNSYIYKSRDKRLGVTELYYLPHWSINPHTPDDKTQFIDYYEYNPSGEAQKIDPQDIIHIRFGLDPDNIRKGLAPLKSLFREIFTDDEAANFSASLLRNMGIPGVIISPASDNTTVTQADKQAVKESFKQKFGGDNRGEPLVMTAKTDVKLFGFSPAEMDLGKLREIPEERVTSILGVPAAVVGFGTGLQQTKVGATMRELREAAYEDCIIPMQNIFSDELNTQLLPEFEPSADEWGIDFDLSQIRVLQEDENAKSIRIQGQVKDCIITVAEGRKKLGYEVKPGQNVYLLPFNIAPTENFMSGQAMPTNPEQPEKYFFPVYPLKQSRNWRNALLRQFQKSLIRYTAIFAGELKKEFQKIGDVAGDIFERMIEERGIRTLSATPAQQKDGLAASLITAIIATIDFKKSMDYKRHYKRVAEDTYKNISLIIGTEFNLTDDQEFRILTAGGTRRGLVDLEQQTKDVIFKTLEEGREQGLSAYEIAYKLRDEVAAGPWSSSTIRANVIARTETKNAQNVSSLEAYKSGGIDKVEIVDGQLPTSDDECIARNGTIISIELAGGIDEHPNGTLSYTPVIADLPGEGE